MSLYLNKQIKKIIKDYSGYYFAFEIELSHQFIYQKINESAYEILVYISQGYSEKEIIELLENKYENDPNAKVKVVEFLNYLEKYNLITQNISESHRIKLIVNENVITPKYCILEISSNCLLNCSHCYLGKKDTKFVDILKIKQIIQELYDLGIDFLQLTGGEPLLHPQFNEIVDFIKDKDIRIAITTSGFLSSKYLGNLYSLLKIRDKCFLQVSVDGLENTHNEIRGNKCAFAKTMEFIKLAKKLGFSTTVATVVQQKNIQELEELTKKLKEIGIKKLRFSSLMEEGYANKKDIIDSQTVIEITKRLSSVYGDSNFGIVSLEDSLEFLENRKTNNCGCGSELFAIDTELNFYNCVLYRKSNYNLKEMTLKEILNKESVKNYKIIAPNKNDCKNCKNVNYCRGCITLGRLEHDKCACHWGEKWNL